MDATLLLALAAVVAGSRPVRVPSLGIDVQPIHPFVLLAITVNGAVAAGLVGMAGLLGAAAGRRPAPRLSRLSFNLAVSVVSTTAAAWAAQSLGGRAGATPGEWMWPLAAATLVYFASGTGLVAAAVALEKRQSYLATWNRSLRWTALPYAVGFTIAVAALSVSEASVGAAIALTIAPCYCLVLVYRAEAARRSVGAA